ncbi:MAG: hypothetical protein OWQ57_05820 [Sulfobacillus sp.]|nr:hypothetical protein [Sulfobacillus sp.]
MAAQQEFPDMDTMAFETRQYRHLTVIRTDGHSRRPRLIVGSFWVASTVLFIGLTLFGLWFPATPVTGAGPAPQFPAMSRGIQEPFGHPGLR